MHAAPSALTHAASSQAVTSALPLTFGLEEELFVLYQGRSSLGSLWPMGQLLWQEPGRNWAATATNFRRGKAAWREPMSSVEVSTGIEGSAATLFMATMARRAELSRLFTTGQLVALGALPSSDRYHTCGLHVHIGVPANQTRRVYGNLAYFLPVLTRASSSSPYFARQLHPDGLGRVSASFALGRLGDDRYERFQDIIITRRLGTIELRVLDPVPDPERLWAILKAIEGVARLPHTLPFEAEMYNALRAEALTGYSSNLQVRAQELQDTTGFDPHWAEHTEAQRVVAHTQQHGWASTLAHLDGLYRTGLWQDLATPHPRPPHWQGPAGFARYYLPKLPAIARKAYIENKK